MAQNINLTAGHTYVLSCKDPYVEGTSGIQSVTQDENVLTVENLSSFDFADLGAGTDTGDAKVIVNTPEGVWNAKGTRVHVELDDGFYWLDDGSYVQPPPPVVGVTITESESDCYNRVQYAQTLSTGEGTYDNIAYGATPMSGAGSSFNVGSWGSGDLADFISGIKPVSFDGTTWTDLSTTSETNWPSTQGTDCFTEFPFRWLSITKSNGVITIVFSDAEEAPDSTFQNWAFLGADGVTQRPNFHLGCYTASGSVSDNMMISGGVYSQKGSANALGAYLNQYWVGASRRGAEYDCLPFQQWTYIQALFLVLYKSTDSQTAHSKGYVEDYSIQNNPAFASYGNNYGMYGSTANTTTENAFFWLHNLWGNYSQYSASLFVRASNSDSSLYYILGAMSNSSNWDNNSWNSSSNVAKMTSLGTDSGSDGPQGSDYTAYGYFVNACGSNGAGFLPVSGTLTGSSTTYYPDYRSPVSLASYSAGFLRISGPNEWEGGSYDEHMTGLFKCFIGNSSLYSGDFICSRLSYRGGHNY